MKYYLQHHPDYSTNFVDQVTGETVLSLESGGLLPYEDLQRILDALNAVYELGAKQTILEQSDDPANPDVAFIKASFNNQAINADVCVAGLEVLRRLKAFPGIPRPSVLLEAPHPTIEPNRTGELVVAWIANGLYCRVDIDQEAYATGYFEYRSTGEHGFVEAGSDEYGLYTAPAIGLPGIYKYGKTDVEAIVAVLGMASVGTH